MAANNVPPFDSQQSASRRVPTPYQMHKRRARKTCHLFAMLSERTVNSERTAFITGIESTEKNATRINDAFHIALDVSSTAMHKKRYQEIAAKQQRRERFQCTTDRRRCSCSPTRKLPRQACLSCVLNWQRGRRRDKTNNLHCFCAAPRRRCLCSAGTPQ